MDAQSRHTASVQLSHGFHLPCIIFLFATDVEAISNTTWPGSAYRPVLARAKAPELPLNPRRIKSWLLLPDRVAKSFRCNINRKLKGAAAIAT